MKRKILKKFISFFMLSTLVAPVVLLTNSTSNSENYFLKFNNKIFNNEEELFEYVDQNTTKNEIKKMIKNYNFNNNSYSMDNIMNLYQDMKKAFYLNEEHTYRNTKDFLINETGQLSRGVEYNTGDYEGVIYKGKDNNAYINKEEAINTYLNYKKVYQFESIGDEQNSSTLYFENKNDLIHYIDKTKTEELKNGLKNTCYEMSGSCLDKNLIKKWIGDTTIRNYKYNGSEWNDYSPMNPNDLLISEQDKKEYIKEYKPGLNNYWIDINQDSFGSFYGTQLLQSNDDDKTVFDQFNKWEIVDSEKINPLFLSATFIGSLFLMDYFLDKINKPKDEDNTWFFDKDFLRSENERKEFRQILLKYTGDDETFSETDLIKDLEESLNKPKQFPKKYKNLIFIRKLKEIFMSHNYVTLIPEDAKFVNKFWKNKIKESIYSGNLHKELENNIVDELFDLENDDIKSEDIIDFFVNPSKFQYASPTNTKDIFYSINKWTNSVTDWLFGTNQYNGLDSKNDLKNIFTKLLNVNKELNDVKIRDILDNEISNYNISNMEDGQFKIESNSYSPADFLALIIPGLNEVISAWNTINEINPFRYKTKKIDFGNGQELFYRYMAIDLPFTNYEIMGSDPAKKVRIDKLIDRDESLVTESGNVYELLGYIYKDRESAEKRLKELIVNTPDNFIETSKFYISLMEQEITSDEITPDSNTETLREAFINDIFNKFFEYKKITAYTDGFGGQFNDQTSALQSMRQHVSNQEFIIKWGWEDANNKFKLYDDLDTLLIEQKEYIKKRYLQNKVILLNDLFKTTRYNELKDSYGFTQTYWSFAHKGRKYNFLTKNQAESELLKLNNIKLIRNEIIQTEYYMNNMHFSSREKLIAYVLNNVEYIDERGVGLNA